ncbi:MAG: hypothetical protein AAFX99_14870, partial [Myxococcota bacterium]
LFHLGRLPRARYLEIETELRTYLERTLGPEGFRIPRYYDTKPDFGDLDVVLCAEVVHQVVGPGTDWRTWLADDLGIAESIRNPSVFSTVYRQFQVDYFIRPQDTFESTAHFLSYNDLGNLLGRIFRRLHLKYGERGLEYVYRRADGQTKRVLPVSREMSRILAFIGLDYATWDKGFHDLEQIYTWVISSPWFSVDPYLDPGRSIERRTRKRPTMRRFIAYLEAESIDKRCVYPPREVMIPKVAAFFPQAQLLDAIAREEAAEARAAQIRAKFSGKRIMAWVPELRGDALGRFIRSFKAQFEAFDDAIEAMTAQEVERQVLRFWQQYAATHPPSSDRSKTEADEPPQQP